MDELADRSAGSKCSHTQLLTRWQFARLAAATHSICICMHSITRTYASQRSHALSFTPFCPGARCFSRCNQHSHKFIPQKNAACRKINLLFGASCFIRAAVRRSRVHRFRCLTQSIREPLPPPLLAPPLASPCHTEIFFHR